MDSLTITFLNKAGENAIHQGLWTEVNSGIVLIHTRASQTFIPWHRVLMIQQTVTTSGIPFHEVQNKQLTNRLRSD